MVVRNNRRNWVAVFPPLNIWLGLVRTEGELKKTKKIGWWDHQEGNELRLALQLW